MRGDAGLTARLLLRGAGLAGVVASFGGTIALTSVLRPWHVAVAEVTMLGSSDEGPMPGPAGPADTWEAWAAGGLGAVLLVLGILLALDRAPGHSRATIVIVAAVLVTIAAGALLFVPDVESLADDATTALLSRGDDLPVGVDLQVRTRPTIGPWIAMAGAVVAIVGALGARDGRRRPAGPLRD